VPARRILNLQNTMKTSIPIKTVSDHPCGRFLIRLACEAACLMRQGCLPQQEAAHRAAQHLQPMCREARSECGRSPNPPRMVAMGQGLSFIRQDAVLDFTLFEHVCFEPPGGNKNIPVEQTTM
jgi:hypothetical protein